ncbi:hypothetical protein J7L65_01935 [Candidatus Bathyarchaeota archaeon]|nr:hypothetical protein [Candidatus Bathyarchaeota archaeon]
MNALQLLSLTIFLFVLLLIVSESIHRTYASLIGAGIFILIGVVNPERLLEYMELDILCIVFGMMLLVRGAERSGIFSYIASRMMRFSPSSTLLAILLLTFTMILTIFLNNIGAMLISATLTLLIARSGELRPQTILIFQAIITNVGGLVLMVSSIPNIIVAMEGGIPFNSFLLTMTPIAFILYLATLLLYLRELKGERLERRELRPIKPLEWVEDLLGVKVEMDLEREIGSLNGFNFERLGPPPELRVDFGPLQAAAAAIIGGTIIAFALHALIGATPPLIALAGGVTMLMLVEKEPREALGEIDWPTILFLAGLFVMINGLDNIGVIEMASLAISRAVHGRGYLMPIVVLWLSAFASAFIDNIPLTATFAPIAKHLIVEGGPSTIWWGLILGANLGGNLFPLGSPSNIIAVGVAEQEGKPLSIKRFTKIGFTAASIHLFISTLYLIVLSLHL